MKKILIVSASCQATVLLSERLKGYGLDSYAVTTGRGCLEMIDNNEICTVVIDNSILDIDGSTLLGLVIKVCPRVNLIFANSEHNSYIESQVRQAGITYYTTDMRDEQIVSVILELHSKQPLMNSMAGKFIKSAHKVRDQN